MEIKNYKKMDQSDFKDFEEKGLNVKVCKSTLFPNLNFKDPQIVEVRETDTIWKLKVLIFEKTDILPCSQILFKKQGSSDQNDTYQVKKKKI